MNKVLLILGIILVVAGIISQIYTTTEEKSYVFGLIKTSETTKPYTDFSIPLIIGGAILIVVSIAINSNSKNKPKIIRKIEKIVPKS